MLSLTISTYDNLFGFIISDSVVALKYSGGGVVVVDGNIVVVSSLTGK